MKEMKRLAIIGFGVAVALLSVKVFAQDSTEKVIGLWYAEELEQSIIEVVSLEDGSFEGVIKSSSTPKYVGHKVIYDFRFDAEENKYKGTISSAARNMELDGSITIEEDGRLKLTGKKLFMSKTFYWERKH